MTGDIVPKVELFDSDDGLIFSFTSAVFSTQAQQPQQKPPDTPQTGSQTQHDTTRPSDQTPATPEAVSPGSQAQQGETLADENELIEIVVTGEQKTGYSVPNPLARRGQILRYVIFPSRFKLSLDRY